MRKINKLLFVFVFALLAFLIMPKTVVAEGEVPQVVVDIEAVFDGENDATINDGSHELGSELNIDAYINEGYTFAFWVVNGVVDHNRGAGTTFIVTSTLNAQAVYHPNDKHAVLFIDSNGKLLDTKYVDPFADLSESLPDTTNLTKPGYVVNPENPWKSLVGSEDVNSITGNTVFQLQYKLEVEETITIKVNSVDQQAEYNSLVTLDAGEGNHWVDQYNNVVSYNQEYTFSALYDRELVALENGESETFINFVKLVGARTDYNSLLGSYELHNGDTFIETGFLFLSNTVDKELSIATEDVIVAKSNTQHPVTNEFLTSFPESYLLDSVVAYLLVRGTDSQLRYVYSNVVVSREPETKVLLNYEVGEPVEEVVGTSYTLPTAVTDSGMLNNNMQADITWKDDNGAVSSVVRNLVRDEVVELEVVVGQEHTHFLFDKGDFDWSSGTSDYSLHYWSDSTGDINVLFFEYDSTNSNLLKAYLKNNDHANVIAGFEMMFKQDNDTKTSNWIPQGVTINTGTRIYYVEQWINGNWSATLDVENNVKDLTFKSSPIASWGAYYLRVVGKKAGENDTLVEVFIYNWQGTGTNSVDNGIDGSKTYTLKVVKELGFEFLEIWFTQYIDDGHRHKGSVPINWNDIGNINLHDVWIDGRWTWTSS